MSIYIISWTTRMEQEKLFLRYIDNFAKNHLIYYCVTHISKEINYSVYKNITFLDYNLWLRTLKEAKWPIIFYDYYNNLWNFNFSWYNLIAFWNYLFFSKDKWVEKFKNLENVYVFDFFKIKQSRREYEKLFSTAKNIVLVNSINYPSALPILKEEGVVNHIYDIYIPLGGIISYEIVLWIIQNNQNLNFIIWPIDHPNNNSFNEKIDDFLAAIKTYNNVTLHRLENVNFVLKTIRMSKIILLPLIKNTSVVWDLTRIADSLASWKIILTNRVKANSHINWLIFFDSLSDCQKKLDLIYQKKLFNDMEYKKKVLSIYKKEHNVEVLILQLLKFLVSQDAPM